MITGPPGAMRLPAMRLPYESWNVIYDAPGLGRVLVVGADPDTAYYALYGRQANRPARRPLRHLVPIDPWDYEWRPEDCPF